MTQKALVVAARADGTPTPSLQTLADLLRAGWRVAQASPMGGGGAADGFASLVVLERAAETEAEAILDHIAEEMDEDAGAPEIQDPVLRRLQSDGPTHESAGPREESRR